MLEAKFEEDPLLRLILIIHALLYFLFTFEIFLFTYHSSFLIEK